MSALICFFSGSNHYSSPSSRTKGRHPSLVSLLASFVTLFPSKSDPPPHIFKICFNSVRKSQSVTFLLLISLLLHLQLLLQFHYNILLSTPAPPHVHQCGLSLSLIQILYQRHPHLLILLYRHQYLDHRGIPQSFLLTISVNEHHLDADSKQ